MTKKSLSDLLKEEASKADTLGEASAPANPSDEMTPAPEGETARQPIQSRRKTASSRAKTPPGTPAKSTPAQGAGRATAKPKTTVQPSDLPSNQPSDSDSPSNQPGSAPPATLPVAEKVDDSSSVPAPSGPSTAELEAALATVRQEKADLENMVQGLQQDLAAQQSRLFELTDSFDQAQADLKAKTTSLQQAEEALAEAKATILKLSAPAPVAVTAPKSPAPLRRSGGDIIPRQPSPGPAQPGYVRGVPTYSPQAEQPNPMLSDADIGWVD